MRRLALLLPLLAAAPPLLSAQGAPALQVEYEEDVLPNGLRVI